MANRAMQKWEAETKKGAVIASRIGASGGAVSRWRAKSPFRP